MKNIKTFEQFNYNDIEVNEELFGFGNDSKKIPEFLEDITSKKFEKIDDMKEVYKKYTSKINKFRVKRIVASKAVAGLNDIINKGDRENIPENLEEQIALICIRPDEPEFTNTTGILVKGDKGWKTTDVNKKSAPMDSGGAGNARWS